MKDKKKTMRFANGKGKLREKIRKPMEKSPLWLTFMLLMAFFMIIMASVLSFTYFRFGRQNAIDQHNDATSELLTMKLQNLEDYFSDLSEFCIQPVYSSASYNALLSESPIDEADLGNLVSTASLSYFTRTDLTAYRLDLLNQNLSIERTPEDQHITTDTSVGTRNTEEYQECVSSSKNFAVFPATYDGSMLRFCHTIIRIRDKKPVALVTIEVDDRAMRKSFDGMITALYNRDRMLLYTNAQGALRDGIENGEIALTSVQAADPGEPIKTSYGEYLHVCQTSDSSGITLMVLTPLSSITDELSSIRLSNTLFVFGFAILSLGITFVLIRYLTAPLTTLAASQSKIASGSYQKIHIGRSWEAAMLSNSFNDMAEHIDKLVNENLVSSINERNARIAALEAQTNPHFLYNTLQAIGTQALMNDQEEIYDMLIRLSKNMRYSINGESESLLSGELQFTDNYITLMKLRMGDHLTTEERIDQDVLDSVVPKCSVQLIAENAILHGFTGTVTDLHLMIEAFRKDGLLNIRVRDNGAGMSREKLEEVTGRIRSYKPGDTSQPGTDAEKKSTGIGLLNLYSRLQIMYEGHADLLIESSNGDDHYTCVTMVLEEGACTKH